MNIRNEFTEPECEWFRNVCNFTPDELAVFNLRVKDNSRIQIAMQLKMSESSVDRRMRGIKKKIHKVLSSYQLSF